MPFSAFINYLRQHLKTRPSEGKTSVVVLVTSTTNLFKFDLLNEQRSFCAHNKVALISSKPQRLLMLGEPLIDFETGELIFVAGSDEESSEQPAS